MQRDEVTEEQVLWEILGGLSGAVSVKFFIITFFGSMLSIFGYLTGGLVAGLVARCGMGRGILAGIVAGVFGGMTVIDRTLGMISLMGIEGILGGFLGGIMGSILGRVIGRMVLRYL